MNLPLPEVEQYYRIWWPLLAYVNERRRLVPRVIGKAIKGGVLSTEEAAKILNAFRKELLKSGLGVGTVERHVGAVEAFADTYLLELDPPRPLLDMTAADLRAYLEQERLTQEEERAVVGSFRRFARFLWNTERSHPDTIVDLQELLKEYRRQTA